MKKEPYFAGGITYCTCIYLYELYPSLSCPLVQEPASGTLLTDEDVRRYGYGFHSEDYGDLFEDVCLLADRLFPVFNTLLGPTFPWAKDFQTRADLGDDHEKQVAYPVWLTLIKDRLQNGFYR